MKPVLGSPAKEFLARGRTIKIEYAPFDHIESGARLVVLGITPGAQQKLLAETALQNALAAGNSGATASRMAKFAASFGGAMRSNLVRMLDFVGASKWLGLTSFSEAFDPLAGAKVHFTSALRYPVFVDGSNYNGQPDMVGTPQLREVIETLLVAEVEALPDAIWQPLGDKPMAALRYLTQIGKLQSSKIAPALPHPSGANAERIAYFIGEKAVQALSPKTNPNRLDAMRAEIKRFYSALS